MSFLVSIGKLMGGSGLNAVLETIYDKNIVNHIITGKAISRAISGHFLVDAALHTTLTMQLFPEWFLDNEKVFEDESNPSPLFAELCHLYEDLVSAESTWYEVSRSKAIIDFGGGNRKS